MKNTIRIVIVALAITAITACSTSTPVQPMKNTGKTYVPISKGK